MQLSVSSGKHGILQRAMFLTFGDSSDHTTDYPLADMVASSNEWVNKIATKIWKSSFDWRFDDSNQTDMPIATTTLADARQDYEIPADAIEIFRVEVLDKNNNYKKLKQIDQSEISVALSEFNETDGLPQYYDLVGNSIMLYPAPSASEVTTAKGLKLFFSRDNTAFSVPASYTTADTTEPGFDAQFHDIVAYGVATDYLEANEKKSKADGYMQKILDRLNDVSEHYGRKNRDKKQSFTRRSYNLE